jgi:hypothetical protein
MKDPKVVTVQVMKAYMGIMGITPYILNLSSRRR